MSDVYTEVAVCSCGAVTVYIDEIPYSMSKEIFSERYGKLPRSGNAARLPDMGSCNYCVNHWGVDLCGCGSGEKIGECDGGHAECSIPMQSVEEGRRNVVAGDSIGYRG